MLIIFIGGEDAYLPAAGMSTFVLKTNISFCKYFKIKKENTDIWWFDMVIVIGLVVSKRQSLHVIHRKQHTWTCRLYGHDSYIAV